MNHYRKLRKKYISHAEIDLKSKEKCLFCVDEEGHEIIEETDKAFVMRNRLMYNLFDGARVLDHLMVIPKAHRESINDFTDEELVDTFRLAGKYENQGYGVYGRGKGAATRSMTHQHTHLLKLADKAANFVIYSNKPYLLFDR